MYNRDQRVIRIVYDFLAFKGAPFQNHTQWHHRISESVSTVRYIVSLSSQEENGDGYGNTRSLLECRT